MAKDEFSAGDTPADDSGMMGIVVQGRRIVEALPNLSFVWGPPEFQAAPSLPFGRWKPAVKAA
jgi:hypothetical protein